MNRDDKDVRDVIKELESLIHKEHRSADAEPGKEGPVKTDD